MARRHRAAVAALLGERRMAVDLLRQETAGIYLWILLHTGADFDSIRDEPFIDSFLKAVPVRSQR